MSAPKDPVDEAIAATAQPGVALRQVTVTISSTGRPFVVAIPQDMTESELLEAISWMSTQLRISLAQERSKLAGGRIILPTGVLPS